MKKASEFQCDLVIVSVASAIEKVESALEAIGEKKKSICKKIQSVLASLGTQPCDAKLVCEMEGIEDWSAVGFALIGDFPDWDDHGVSRFTLRLREICGGEFDREVLADWLSAEGLSVVMEFEHEILRVTTECRYLSRLYTKLRRVNRYLEEWRSNRKYALEELAFYFKTES